MGQGPNRNQNQSAGSLSLNAAANTTGAQVKTGNGTLVALNVNTAGLTSTVTFYDGTSTAGRKLGGFSTLALGRLELNLLFTTGLFWVITGGTPADITVSYR
jgi:hypothetical protein